MLRIRFPRFGGITFRIGSKLALTVGVGVVLVAGMIANQHNNNTLVSQQADMERIERGAIGDLLRASIALQRMQIGTREIRLAISEREAEAALAELTQNMSRADVLLNGALLQCIGAPDCGRLIDLHEMANLYAQTAAEMTRLKKDYAEITVPLAANEKTGKTIDELIEKAISAAQARTSQRTAAATASISQNVRINMGFGLFVISILMGGAAFGVLSIGRPIRQITGMLLRLAGGKRGISIPYTARGDEIGDVARAANTLQDNLMRLEAVEAEQKEAADHLALERETLVREIADKFEKAVGNIVSTVSSAAIELETAALTLTRNAGATQDLSAEATVVSDEASSNVQSIAQATSEFGFSIEEISRQARRSTEIAADAVRQAEETDTRIDRLSKSANQIGEVVAMISAIARQTNLLALNATIEAARATACYEAAVGTNETRKEISQCRICPQTSEPRLIAFRPRKRRGNSRERRRRGIEMGNRVAACGDFRRLGGAGVASDIGRSGAAQGRARPSRYEHLRAAGGDRKTRSASERAARAGHLHRSGKAGGRNHAAASISVL